MNRPGRHHQRTSTGILGISAEEKKGQKNIEIMAPNFSNTMKNIHIHIQEAEQTE